MIVKIEIVILFHAVASFRDRDSDRVPLTVRPVPMVKTLKFQNFNGALNSANYQEIKQSSINAFPPAGHESNKGEFSPDRLFSNHPHRSRDPWLAKSEGENRKKFIWLEFLRASKEKNCFYKH